MSTIIQVPGQFNAYEYDTPLANVSDLHDDSNGKNQPLADTLAEKVDKEAGKSLSTNDYTTTEKNKLAGIAANAEVNQFAFTKVKVGNTTLQADSKTATLILKQAGRAGLTANTSDNSVTISASGEGGSAGTLNTNNASPQTVSSSESLAGAVSLHKISKTGSYEDLNDKPTVLEDKEYEEGANTGMGKKTLSMNEAGGMNLLTQSMMTDPNTTYVIPNDYIIGTATTVDLTRDYTSMTVGGINYFAKATSLFPGETITVTTPGAYLFTSPNGGTTWVAAPNNTYTASANEIVRVGTVAYSSTTSAEYIKTGGSIIIPSGCILEFDGGSITGGTLVGNNTSIKAGLVKIFDPAITFEGTWNVADIYSCWFPNTINCLVSAFALTNASITNNVYIDRENYTLEITEDASGVAAITVDSNTNIYLDGNITLTPYYGTSGVRYGYYIFNLVGDNINITGSGSIIGDRLTTTSKVSEYGHGVVVKGDNIKIENITIKECYGDCVYINGKKNSQNTPIRYTLNNLTLTGYRRNGISVIQTGDGEVTNCYIGDGGDTSPRAAIDVEPNNGDTVGNVLISNCTVSNTRTGFQLLARDNYTNTFVDSMIMENCSLKNITAAFKLSGNGKCNAVKIKDTTADHAVASDSSSAEYFLSISRANIFELSNCVINKDVVDNNLYAFYFNVPGSCMIESSDLSYGGSYLANSLASMSIINSSLNCRSLCATLANTTLEGCKINGYIYPNAFRYCSIRNNVFKLHDKNENNFSAASFAVYLGVRSNADSHSNIIESNTFYMDFSGLELTVSANPIVIQGSNNTIASNVIIDNSLSSGVKNAGILLQNTSENNNVWGNIFEDFGTKRKIVDYSTNNRNIIKTAIPNFGETYPTLSDKYYDNGNCGHMFYNTMLNKPIWWTGTRWKDVIDTIKLPVPDTECIQYLDGDDSDSGGEYKTVTIASNPNLTVKCYSTGTNAGQFIANGTCVESGGRSTKLSKTFVLPAGTYNLTYTLISGSRGNIGKEMAICLNKTSDNSLISGFGSTPTEVILAEDTSCYVGFNFHAGESYNVNVVPSIKNAGLFSLMNVIEDILERLDQLEGN